jgi:molybdopterin-binding protein
MNLEEESERATQMLKGKVVALVTRHRNEEVCVEFSDGTRLYVDRSEDGVELSITGGAEE